MPFPTDFDKTVARVRNLDSFRSEGKIANEYMKGSSRCAAVGIRHDNFKTHQAIRLRAEERG